MAAHHDLLQQARHLVMHDRGKPKQVNLRRAVSSAYYALFHLLTSEAASRFISGKGRDNVRMIVRRSFVHGTMNEVCKEITKRTLTDRYRVIFGVGVSDTLKNIAQTFVNLQQARHEADYDFLKTFSRIEAATLIAQVEIAFADWGLIRKTIPADTFLVVMLTSKKVS